MKKRNLLSAVLALGFLLGVRDGYLTLWKDGVKDPLTTFPYRAELLPESDRQCKSYRNSFP